MKYSDIVIHSLKEKKILLNENDSLLGIKISFYEDEVVIKGSQLDLIELADLLVNVALSDEKNSHLHVDDLTLIDSNSEVKNLIIEKESKNE